MPEDLVKALEIKQKTGTFPNNFQFNPNSRLIGFSSHPTNPMSDALAARKNDTPYFTFDTSKLKMRTVQHTIFREYYGNINVLNPFVYFRAEVKQTHQYVVKVNTTYVVKTYIPPGATNGPKPYYDATSQSWVNPESYQILFCGFDNTFGTGNWYPLGKWLPTDPPKLPPPYIVSKIFFQYDTANYDDITNFAGGKVGSKTP